MVYVLYDLLLRAYYVYEHENDESLMGSDGKYTWNKIDELPEEYYGSCHNYTYDELIFDTEGWDG